MRVFIHRLSPRITQSGQSKKEVWSIDPILENARKPEPLMGWQRADDTLTELSGKLHFSSAEQALTFAKKQGWAATLIPPSPDSHVARSYLDNFKIRTPLDEERTSYR